MTFGQPPDTASMNFEGSRSMVWVMESLTAVPLGSSSIVQSDVAFGLEFGPVLVLPADHQAPWRVGLDDLAGVEDAGRRRSTIFHEDPAVHWLSQCMPNQYCFMNSASVSADHSFSGVVRI